MRLPGDAWHRPYKDLMVVRKLKLEVLGWKPVLQVHLYEPLSESFQPA